MRHLRPASTLLALTLAGATLAACASEQPSVPRRDPKLDPTLFLSPAGKPFHADPGQPYPVRQWFAEADRDHDGKLTRDEMRADFETFFRQLDTNHDGFIDGLETAAYEETVAPEILPRLAQMQAREVRPETPDGELPQRGGRREGLQPRRLAQAPQRRGQTGFDGAPEFSLLNVSEPVASADLNFDGKVSLQEFIAAADRRFAALDVDKQGYLTLDSLPQTPEQAAVEGKRPQRR